MKHPSSTDWDNLRPHGTRYRDLAPGRWTNGTYVVDGSVVGTCEQDAFGRGYWAYGCMSSWQDTKLGLHKRESQAHHAVEKWVKNNQ
jgi:hypothetical protein